MDKTVDQFYQSFCGELSLAKQNDALNKEEDFFTSLMFEYLQEAGIVDEPTLCSFRDNGIQISGFEFSPDYSFLTIFVSIFTETESLISVSKTDLNSALSRAFNVFRKAILNKVDQFSASTDLYDLVHQIYLKKGTIKSLSITALTNGVVRDVNFQSVPFYSTNVTYNVWDMDRLFKCMASGQQREPINVDFIHYLGHPLPALRGGNSEKTQVYVAILPGKLLSDLYVDYRDKLLERNVRAYLQRKSDVNKGLIETLSDQPDMFLAYNNGITVTAAAIVADPSNDGGSVNISKIEDFQIVNGGQTTVSIFQAGRDNTIEVDFSKVFVQMKLAVVESVSDMDEIVPMISKCSNSQNRIQASDFASNDPYHQEMEKLSRSIWSPAKNGHKPVQWFFERARGQYASALNENPTPSKRREYKEFHPLLTKTDLAKVLMSWSMEPTTVALGAQKCFVKFMDKIGDGKKITPNETYFKNCISKTILFRKIEKIVLSQKFGGYKADIVAYTYYKLLKLTARKIDLKSIWELQDISPTLASEIEALCKIIRNYIITAPSGANISEFCKSKRCVEGVDAIEYVLGEKTESELLKEEITDNFDTPTSAEPLTEEQVATIEKATSISANEWQKMGIWAKETSSLNSWERSMLFSLYQLRKRNKKPTFKQASKALDIHSKAIGLGFEMK